MEALGQIVLSAVTASATTLLVQQIASRYWLAQERWRFKADYYARLLQNLGEHLTIRQWFDEPRPQEVADMPHIKAVAEEKGRRSRELYAEQARLMAVADVWLGPNARRALEDFRQNEAEADRAGSYLLAAQSCEVALSSLKRAAQGDLDLDVH